MTPASPRATSGRERNLTEVLGPAAVSVAIVAAVCLGATVVWAPLVALLPIAVIAAALIARFSWARTTAVVAGGLLVLQASDSLSLQKFVYLAFALIAGTIAFARVMGRFRMFAPELQHIVIAALCWGVLVTAAILIAGTNQVSFSVAARDALPYSLLALAPFLALDLGLDAKPTHLLVLTVSAGTAAAIGTAVAFTSRRGVSSLSFGFVGLPSFSLAALGILAAAAMWLAGRMRLFSATAFSVSLSSVLIPGTRTNLVVLGGLFALLGSQRAGFQRRTKTLLGIAIALVFGALLLFIVAPKVLSDSSFLQGRWDLAVRVLRGSVSQDMSGRSRIAAYQSAWSAWRDHLWVGTGPGYSYPYYGTSSAYLDTPVLFLAKFGLVGLVVVLTLLGTILRAAHIHAGPSRLAWPIARAFAVVTLLLVPFVTPLEDKGFPLAVLLLLALVFAECEQMRKTQLAQGAEGGAAGLTLGGPAPTAGREGFP